jgi:hypothetical protein
MTSTKSLQERWTPPKDAPSTMYYPMYGGYQSSSSTPVIFDNPTAALTWSITRLKRDGIGNTWSGFELPEWSRYVGLVYVSRHEVEKISMPYLHRLSQLEAEYFSGVEFFQVTHPFSMRSSSQYIKADEAVFVSCLSTLNEFQDYQLSSNSLYLRGKRCPTDGATSYKFVVLILF